MLYGTGRAQSWRLCSPELPGNFASLKVIKPAVISPCGSISAAKETNQETKNKLPVPSTASHAGTHACLETLQTICGLSVTHSRLKSCFTRGLEYNCSLYLVSLYTARGPCATLVVWQRLATHVRCNSSGSVIAVSLQSCLCVRESF